LHEVLQVTQHNKTNFFSHRQLSHDRYTSQKKYDKAQAQTFCY